MTGCSGPSIKLTLDATFFRTTSLNWETIRINYDQKGITWALSHARVVQCFRGLEPSSAYNHTPWDQTAAFLFRLDESLAEQYQIFFWFPTLGSSMAKIAFVTLQKEFLIMHEGKHCITCKVTSPCCYNKPNTVQLFWECSDMHFWVPAGTWQGHSVGLTTYSQSGHMSFFNTAVCSWYSRQWVCSSLLWLDGSRVCCSMPWAEA